MDCCIFYFGKHSSLYMFSGCLHVNCYLFVSHLYCFMTMCVNLGKIKMIIYSCKSVFLFHQLTLHVTGDAGDSTLPKRENFRVEELIKFTVPELFLICNILTLIAVNKVFHFLKFIIIQCCTKVKKINVLQDH